MTAKLAPPELPTKKVEALDVPPFAAAFATVIFAVPIAAMSAAVIAACKLVLETNVVGRGIPFHCTEEDGRKLAPVTATVNAPPPTIADPGLKSAIEGGANCTVNDTLLDVPPPGVGLATVTVAVPPLAMSVPSIAACKLVLERNVVGRELPFHRTVDEETKFVPVIVNVKAGLPSSSTFGLSDVTVGIGLLMVKVNALDVPPPGLGLDTATCAVPAAAMSAAVMSACRPVLETNVVVRELPFHKTVDEGIKLAPATASVKEAVPAFTELGLRVPDIREGTGLFDGGGGLPELPLHPQIHAKVKRTTRTRATAAGTLQTDRHF